MDVDGREILVTAAVDDLLFHQRSIFSPKLFWIDAICIDQMNLNEKNVQLPLMAQIYGRASRVLVWLGPPETSHSTRLIRKMIRVLTWPEMIFKTRDFLPRLIDNQEEAYVAVAKLFSHKWFQRIWVVQEVTSGKTVHVMYNGTCIDWDVLAGAEQRLTTDSLLKDRLLYYNSPKVSSTDMSDPKLGRSATIDIIQHWPSLSSLEEIRNSVQKGKRYPLAHLLFMTTPCQAKNPRDKVFALVGISKDGNHLPFKPDYKDEVDDVFLKTTTFLLSSPKEWFYILTVAGRGPESHNVKERLLQDTLPSWVPDYNFNSLHLSGARRPAAASVKLRDLAGIATITSNPRILHLQALPFSKTRYIVGPFKIQGSGSYLPNLNAPESSYSAQLRQFQNLSFSDKRRWYLEARQLCYQHSSSAHISREAADQAFWELCMSEKEYIDEVSPAPAICDPLSPKAKKFFENILLEEHVGPHALNPGTVEILGNGVKIEDALLMAMYLMGRFTFSSAHKGFAVMTTGEMALVSPLSRVGDLCVHVRGGYIPVVLRESGKGGRTARLVGTCKVQDVADVYSGERWEDWFLE